MMNLTVQQDREKSKLCRGFCRKFAHVVTVIAVTFCCSISAFSQQATAPSRLNRSENHSAKFFRLSETWVQPTGTSSVSVDVNSTSASQAGKSGIANSATDIATGPGGPAEATASPSQLTSPHKNTGFLDLNSYWDTRKFAVTTINAGAKLDHKFEYFQLLNLESAIDSGSFDWTSFYTEMNLRRPVWSQNENLKQLDWTIQYADGSTANAVLRLGTRWRIHDTPGEVGKFFSDFLKLKYAITLYWIETDGTGWQLEHTYRRDFLDKRFYVSAFADHHINNGNRNSAWVTEHQAGVRLFDQWHAVAEYRYNSFAPAGLRSGWGYGLEYVIRFK